MPLYNVRESDPMAVSIDQSEVRNRSSITSPLQKRRARFPLRAVLIGGVGGAALLAFSVAAFSFFSDLADPRTRAPRFAPAAASMPDLKDGLPALVSGEPAGAAPRAATLNLPRPNAAEPPPAAVQPAALPGVAEPAPSDTGASEAEALPLRTGVNPPPIQNAATLPETETTTVVKPVRTVATIAPDRAETVKAKPVPASSVAALPRTAPDPTQEPTSTATAVAAPVAATTRKPVAAKPSVQKNAARKAGPSKTVADASEPAPVEAAPASPATSAASDEPEIPGARQLREGLKAIGGIFGGSKDD